MNPHASYAAQGRSDAPLWAAALVLSVLLNAVVLLAMSSESMRKLLTSREIAPPAPQPPAEHVLQMIFAPPEPDPAPQPDETRPRFARTSEDQRSAEPPERADFIGERDTRAASELTPDADAPPLPAQAGVEPRSPDDIETTESDFRDGPLDGPDADDAASTLTALPQAPGADVEAPGEAATREAVDARPPATERLLEGPLTTDVPVPMVPEPEEEKPPAPEPVEAPPQGVAEATPETPRDAQPENATVADPTRNPPGFRGHQRKTAVRGSISRTGRSSLDVQDNAMGRYQARISRAVELEWQRNCVRHRDFITPGFLTVRFFVEHTGRVRTVEFVGEMETGEVQKGFTLNSIRNAPIPPMPAELRRELDGEPLELIFNFYF